MGLKKITRPKELDFNRLINSKKKMIRNFYSKESYFSKSNLDYYDIERIINQNQIRKKIYSLREEIGDEEYVFYEKIEENIINENSFPNKCRKKDEMELEDIENIE